MEEFPPNTRTAFQQPAPPPAPPAEDKKIEKVVVNRVVRRKRSLGSRVRETFLGADAQNVRQYVVLDVLIPAAKDMITDAVSGGIERLLFGDSHYYNPRVRSGRGGRPRVYTQYEQYAGRGSRTRPPFPDDRQPRRELSRRARTSHNFEEVVLTTRAEAHEVLDRMYDLLDRYQHVSVSDLYNLLDLTPAYTDANWGWYDLSGAKVRRISSGYLLDLSQPEPLD